MCSDCTGQPALVPSPGDGQALSPAGRSSGDDRAFVSVATAEDPLTAEALEGALQDAGIAVITRSHQAGGVDLMTSGLNHAWFEVLVPEPDAARAVEIIIEERARLAASEEEALRAAEEEAVKG